MSRRDGTFVSYGNSLFQLYFDISPSYQGNKTGKYERFKHPPWPLQYKHMLFSNLNNRCKNAAAVEIPDHLKHARP